jgi:hypothetical protein
VLWRSLTRPLQQSVGHYPSEFRTSPSFNPKPNIHRPDLSWRFTQRKQLRRKAVINSTVVRGTITIARPRPFEYVRLSEPIKRESSDANKQHPARPFDPLQRWLLAHVGLPGGRIPWRVGALAHGKVGQSTVDLGRVHPVPGAWTRARGDDRRTPTPTPILAGANCCTVVAEYKSMMISTVGGSRGFREIPLDGAAIADW